VLIVIVITLIAVGALGWWLLIETEGVYLGRRVVILLYDLYAGRYDRTKAFEPEFDFALLAVPIMNAIEPYCTPLVLDVATGTGRLPKALLSHARFNGHIIGIDLSRRMLHQAAENLADTRDWVDLMHAPAENLPFLDASFDVVTCLEALEFFSDLKVVLQEMMRVLRPGGLLLVTNRINTRWMPGRTYNANEFMALLAEFGLCNVYTEPWQIDYQRVWARKPGTYSPSEPVPLHRILRCPCGSERLDVERPCQQCGRVLQVGADDILEWVRGIQ
jgi:ubiquinone/menaquinone biosynthesis C-methylase UbiE